MVSNLQNKFHLLQQTQKGPLVVERCSSGRVVDKVDLEAIKDEHIPLNLDLKEML